jgi:hypothetical protein
MTSMDANEIPIRYVIVLDMVFAVIPEERADLPETIIELFCTRMINHSNNWEELKGHNQ